MYIVIWYPVTLLGYFAAYNLSWGQSWLSGTKCDCKTDWLWVWSPLEEMKHFLKFIFPFLRSGVEAKRGFDFCHSTRNASRIRQKVGSFLTLGSLCLPCCGRDTEWSWFIFFAFSPYNVTLVQVISAQLAHSKRHKLGTELNWSLW